MLKQKFNGIKHGGLTHEGNEVLIMIVLIIMQTSTPPKLYDQVVCLHVHTHTWKVLDTVHTVAIAKQPNSS